jgi:hypothetical protein
MDTNGVKSQGTGKVEQFYYKYRYRDLCLGDVDLVSTKEGRMTLCYIN